MINEEGYFHKFPLSSLLFGQLREIKQKIKEQEEPKQQDKKEAVNEQKKK